MACQFIVNRMAGKQLFRKKLDGLRRDFERRLGSFDYVCPQSREETIAAARAALRAGADTIVAVGGDGTVNAVVNGFFDAGVCINPAARLVVTRWGTGCDYYRAIAGDTPWETLVTDHVEVAVDLGEIAFLSGKTPNLFFANIASVGMSAEVVLRTLYFLRNKRSRASTLSTSSSTHKMECFIRRPSLGS